MNTTLTLDSGSFMSWADRWHDELNVDVNTFMRYQMRLCLKKCIDWTPPQSLAAGRDKPAADFSRASQPAGAGVAPLVMSRVSRGRLTGFDSTTASFGASNEATFEFQMARFQELIKRNDYSGFNALLKQMKGNLSKWEAVPFSESLFTNAPRTGAGGIKTQRKFIFDVAAWKKQLAKVLSHIGRLKAGWLPAYYSVGGKNVAKWIHKHAIGARGDFQVERGKNNIVVIATNSALGVARSKAIVTRAIESQSRSMVKDFHMYLSGKKDRSQIT